MTDRSRHPAAVFLIPAIYVLALAVWAALSPDRAAAVIERSGGLVFMLIAALLTFSVVLYAFLKARRRRSVWTASLVSSTAVHIMAVILFLLLADEDLSPMAPPAENRYPLSAVPPTMRENAIGKEVREQLLKTAEPTLKPIEDSKAPLKEAPEQPRARAVAELPKLEPEAPARLTPAVAEVAPKPKEIKEELSGTHPPKVDLLPAKVVTMREAEDGKTKQTAAEPRDNRKLELSPARREPPPPGAPETRLLPAERQVALREPARPKQEKIQAVDATRAGIDDKLQSTPIAAPVQNLPIPLAQAPRQAQATEPAATLPLPQPVELARQRSDLPDKPLHAASAPVRPAELVQPAEASLVKAESLAQPARERTPEARLSGAGARKADRESPVKLQDSMAAIAARGDAASGREAAPVRSRALKQDRAGKTILPEADAGEKPKVEMGSAAEAPAETLVGKLYEAMVRQGTVAPVLDETMQTVSVDKPMPLTKAVGGSAVTLEGSAGGGAKQAAALGPAALAAERAGTGLAGAEAAFARPVGRTRGAVSAPGSRDSTLIASDGAQGSPGPKTPALQETGLMAGSAAAAGGAQGLPDMAPGMAPVRQSAAAGSGGAQRMTDRRAFADARSKSGLADSGETASRPSPRLLMEATNELPATLGSYAGGAPGAAAAEPSAAVDETLRASTASATAGGELVRIGIAAAGVQTGDAHAGAASGGTAIAPRGLGASKAVMNRDASESLGAPSRPAGAAALATGPGTSANMQGTLVQGDGVPGGGALRAETAGSLRETLQGTTGNAGGELPIAAVGSVSGVARGAATGAASTGGGAARMPTGRGALSAGKVADSGSLGAADVARPSREIASTGTTAEGRSLAGGAVPAGSAGVAAGIAEGLTQVGSEGGRAAGDVALTSAGVAARAATSGLPGGSGAAGIGGRPADVTLARAGGGAAGIETAERFSAPLQTSGGGAQPAERLVSDAGETATSSGGTGPQMEGALPQSAAGGARNVEAVRVAFVAPRAGRAGGQGSQAMQEGRAPVDGVGLMAAAKAGGGHEGGAAADGVRREAPGAGGGVDRAPARFEVAFDLDSAASGHVRTEGLGEAARQHVSQGSRQALLSVGTAPRPESVPEKAIYQMRKPEKRKQFIVELGGTPESESAVENGLAWLAKAQSDDGRWNLRAYKTLRECGGAGDLATEDEAMTGLVLLSFLGAGYTHTDGIYKDNVRKGLEWLMNGQTEAGDLRGGGTMYGQAIAAAALCESYSLTGDERLIDPCRRAIAFILKAQNPEGAWRYQPRDDNDTSVTGWQILALKSAQIAGIKVPQEHFRWTGMWLDKVRKGKEGGLYCYKSGHPETPVMTAEGWFCQLFMSAQAQARGQSESIRYLMVNLPAWAPENRSVHLYYWYYGTLAMYLSGASEFKEWNEALRTALLKGQVQNGPAAGSWDPVDQLGPRGGRIYTTTAATLCLEVYYRFLPLYKMSKLPGK